MFKQIKTLALTPVAIAIMFKEERKLQAEREAYNAMIAESQAKIGPYVPQPCPVQIWA